jgi:hypothetical protein
VRALVGTADNSGQQPVPHFNKEVYGTTRRCHQRRAEPVGRADIIRMTALGRFALAISVAALLAGCGGSQPPIGAPGATLQSRAIATHAERGGSWMRPEAKSGALLYVVTSDDTLMLNYPGYGRAGTLNPQGFLGFPCADPTNGDVFLDSGSEVRQYSYGAENPIHTIFLKSSAFGYACAIDPTTNGLALTGQHNGKGAVFIYADVSRNARVIADSHLTVFYYCGYDNNGNLFADGLTKKNAFAFAELPKGARRLTNITLSDKVKLPGNVQFDGHYITVRSALTIYQLQIFGHSGTIVGSTTLNQLWAHVPSTWIQGDTVIGAQGGGNHPGHGLGFWHYPQGGKPFKVLTTLSTNKKDVILGSTVSVAPSR